MVLYSAVKPRKKRKEVKHITKGNLLDAVSGLHECPECHQRWFANIKPDSHGKYWRGAQQCPYCKDKEIVLKAMGKL